MSGTGKRDLVLNDALPKITVNADTYEVRADGELMTCAPADVLPQIKGNHGQASKVATQVCEAAKNPPRPAGPSLSDALGTSPPIPDGSKKGAGTFETLTGNPLAK